MPWELEVSEWPYARLGDFINRADMQHVGRALMNKERLISSLD
jgi:hypothetical protein